MYMTQYNGLASIYDQLMRGIDYDEWAEYISELAVLHGGVPEHSALDLACGTGSTTIALAKRGYRTTGLDLSAQMLAMAESKSCGLPVTYLRDDMREFSLPAPVGLAVSFQDGINYLLTQSDLSQTMQAVYHALLPGGLFIFDINRVEKLKSRKSEVSWADCGEFVLIWETRFMDASIWEISLTGFAQTGEGLYRKFNEVHKERVISHDEVTFTLRDAGFIPAGIYEAFTLHEPDDAARRVFYVAKKEA
jgi:SAM-dependent methyltransferase